MQAGEQDYRQAAQLQGAQDAGAPSNAVSEAPQAVQQAQDAHSHGHRDKQVSVDNIDLDELSARIYDRLRSKLRLELLVDRERAGTLTDFR
jgi:hypothetical protein